MIKLLELTKRYRRQHAPAVDRLTLEVATGQTCVLIGPSGCGKTTTMKMINRLIEPTAGRIEVAGQDVSRMDPVRLRRSIGYVIQQVGLFPHMTIAENVATVPELLGWPQARIDARVDEMLALVGLEPPIYRDRHPRELSGGQRQRVGVARALAGDPPVMLMDEPFAAVDPITRSRLQAEFLSILRKLRKTIVFVTHDVDEAIRMGDRIAILRDGRLVQEGTPDEILAYPSTAFVEEFVGADRALKRLQLITAADAMRTDMQRFTVQRGAEGRAHSASAQVEEPLAFRIVVDQERRVLGWVSVTSGSSACEPLRPAATVAADTTVRDALASLVGADTPWAAVVDVNERLVGLLSLEQIGSAIRDRAPRRSER